MEITEFPVKEIKISLLKMFTELKEDTDGQLTEISKMMHEKNKKYQQR